MILENIEPYLEIINLVLAIIIVLFSIITVTKLGGKLKNVGRYFLIAIFLFSIHEIVGILSEFKIIEIKGLYVFTEFVYLAALLVFVFALKQLFENLPGDKR